MVNEQDRARIVAFVHGELSPLEMQRFSERLKVEADLRQEFEAILATSEKLEDLFARKAESDFSAEETATLLAKAKAPTPSSKRPLFIAGGAVFAASLALVVFTKVVKSPEELQGPPPLPVAMSDRNAPPPPAEVLPPVEEAAKGAASDGGGQPAELGEAEATPPSDVAVAAPEPPPPAEAAPEPAPEKPNTRSKNKVAGLQAKKSVKKPPSSRGKMAFDAELAAQSMEEVTAGPVIEPKPVVKMERRSAPKASYSEAAQSEALEAEGDSSQSVAMEDSMAESELANESAPADDGFVEDPSTPPGADVVSHQMGVIASKAKFSKGLNSKRALAFMQRQLDGKPSCADGTAIAGEKRIQAVIHLNAAGEVSRIETAPKSPETAKCLKLRLDGRPDGFKSKSGGKITIQLKIF